MAEKNFNEVVNSLIGGMNGFLSSKTVVGEPVKVGETILVPFVDVSFGVGAGSFRGDKKDNGAGALSGKMTPSAVLIIDRGTTRLVNIRNQDALTKILDMVPDMVNNFTAKKNRTVSDEEAVDTAFSKKDGVTAGEKADAEGKPEAKEKAQQEGQEAAGEKEKNEG